MTAVRTPYDKRPDLFAAAMAAQRSTDTNSRVLAHSIGYQVARGLPIHLLDVEREWAVAAYAAELECRQLMREWDAERAS